MAADDERQDSSHNRSLYVLSDLENPNSIAEGYPAVENRMFLQHPHQSMDLDAPGERRSGFRLGPRCVLSLSASVLSILEDRIHFASLANDRVEID